jgi:hypothetical protein
MLSDVSSVVVPGSRHNSQADDDGLQASCLLCRVLYPSVLPHRHLLLADSSEAKTILHKPFVLKKPATPKNTLTLARA